MTDPQRVLCARCNNTVPPGRFCGACGQRLDGSLDGSHRPDAYVADPEESVLKLTIVSTLMPHIPRRRTGPFRVALAFAFLLLLVLGALKLTGPGVAVAALALPMLFGFYLFEVEVYEDSPWRDVLVALMGIGAGGLWGLVFAPFVTSALLQNSSFDLDARRVLLYGTALHLVAPLTALLTPIAMVRVLRLSESLDAFSFGAVSALGFTFATTLTQIWPELALGLVAPGSRATEALRLVLRGLLVPVVYATTIGLTSAAYWIYRHRVDVPRTARLSSAIAVTVVAHAGLGAVNVTVVDLRISALAYLVVAATMLAWTRFELHEMVLATPHVLSIGPDAICTHCRSIVPTMTFCLRCGIAREATPKAGRRTTTTVLAGMRARPWMWIASLAATSALMAALAIIAVRKAPEPASPCGDPGDCKQPPVVEAPVTLPFDVADAAAYRSATHGFAATPSTGCAISRGDESDGDVTWLIRPGLGYAFDWPVTVRGEPSRDRSARTVISDLRDSEHPDATTAYELPGARIGYVDGYGEVADLVLRPATGRSALARVIAIGAVDGDLSIQILGVGPYVENSERFYGSFPNPAATPIASCIGPIIDNIVWPVRR